MQKPILAAIAAAGVLLACDMGDPPEESRDTGTAGAAARGGGGEDVFIEAPDPAAQIVFVAQDSMPQAGEWRGAVFVPYSTFSVERDGIPNELPPADSLAAMLEAAGVRGDRVVIVGEPIPAGRAFAAFDYLGLGDRAALLDGGPAALGAAPGDASRAAPGGAGAPARDPNPAELETDVRDDMIVDAEWVRDRLDDPNVILLDARPPAEFTGETPGEGIERAGHIPGARNLFWQTLVQSADEPRLKDEAELRRMFEQAGVGPGDTVVAYCRTGGQSSFLYAVARHLGYDVRLYDGSFVDWSRSDYPVER